MADLKMEFKSLTKSLLHKCGFELQNINSRTVPFGTGWRYDVCYYLEPCSVLTALDVGANLGQSAESINKIFRKSNIYCVESVPSTFEALQTVAQQ